MDMTLPTDTPNYRRALWIVALLNSGYGVVEGAGGILSGSQALKADALDFIGDGAVTFLAIAALGWPIVRRARIALMQGFLLGALGLGVLVTTAFRVVTAAPPEPEVMGLLGGIGLAVNLLAAVVLMPYRKGDVNARAVWLYSRNDALGNLAVVVAAAFVAATHTAWPDIIVAAVVASLFLQSSWSIVRKARSTLHEAHNGG
ncbi:MAG: cation transporter [Gemmatimonas sp.]